MPAIDAPPPVPAPAAANAASASPPNAGLITSLSSSPDAVSLPGPPLSPHSISLLLLLSYWLSSTADLSVPLSSPAHSPASPGLTRLALLLQDLIASPPSSSSLPSLPRLERLIASALSAPSDAALSSDCRSWLRLQLAGFTSPDAVDDFFASLRGMLVEVGRAEAEDSEALLRGVDVRSAFGLFVRQQLYAFHSGAFHTIARLWDELQAYREDADAEDDGEERLERPSVAQLQALIGRKGEEVQALMGRLSYDHVERLCAEVEEAATRTAVPLSASAASTSAAVSFLRYLVAVAQFDYEAAINHLHRFTDYSSAASPPPPPSAPSSPASSSVKSGLLNLALLHGRFGHAELAVELIQEAVRIAQQQQDQTVLQQALQLLTTLSGTTPAPSTSALSSSLFDRCVGTLTVSADSATRLIDEWKASGGAGAAPSLHGLEATVAQTHLAVAQSQLMKPLSSSASTSPAAVWSALSAASSVSSLYDLQHCVAVERQLRARVWDLLGSRHLSSLSSELHYRLSPSTTPSADTLSSLYALASDAQRSPGDQQALLQYARAEFPHLSQLPMSDLSLFLDFQAAVRRAELSTAHDLADAIAHASASLNGVVGASMALEARFVWAQLRAMEGAWGEAFDEAERLVTDSEERRDVALTVRFLLFQAHIRMQATEPFPPTPLDGSTSPSPSAVFASTSAAFAALPILMRASTLASKAHAATLSAAVQVALSRVHLAMDRPREGLKCVRQAFPQLVEHGTGEQLMDALYALALCLLNLRPSDSEDDEHVGLTQAADTLELALQAADALRWTTRCLHLSYLLARVYHELGSLEQRDALAHRFLLYHRSATRA